MSVSLLPSARRCTHEDPETGERCITYLCTLNSGPDCFVHSRRRPRSPSPEWLMTARPTPSAEAVAAGLRHLGVEVAEEVAA